MFNNPKQESSKSQCDSKNQARIADAQTSEILNPLLQGPFLAVMMFYSAPVIQDEIRAGRRDGLPREHIRFAMPANARSHPNALRRLELNPHGEPVFRGVAGVHANPERQEHLGQWRAPRSKFHHRDNYLLDAIVRRANLDEAPPIVT